MTGMRPWVLSYPPRHPYVDRFHGTVATLVHRDEPMPELDRFYETEWLRSQRHQVDIAHLHFGHEQHPLPRVLDALRALRRLGIGVVMTVHDLDNPHLRPELDDTVEAVRQMAPLAHTVTTLTDSAATVVQRLTGIRPRVIPHGPLLRPDRMHRARRQRAVAAGGWGPVLVHAKPERPGYDLEAALEAGARLADTVPLRVLVDAEHASHVTDHPAARHVEVVVHDGLSHARLVAHLVASRLLVLPYRHGTHSGLLELAADVGVPVVATDAGCYDEQHPVWTVPVRDRSVDVDALVQAISAAPDRPHLVSPVEQRERLYHAVLRAHRSLYAQVRTRSGLRLPEMHAAGSR